MPTSSAHSSPVSKDSVRQYPPHEQRAIRRSVARLDACIEEGAILGDAAFAEPNLTLARELLDGCDIMCNIHTPKTGGTSIKSELANTRPLRLN